MIYGKRYTFGEFAGGPVVRTLCFTAKGVGSVPGWGTKIPQAMKHGQKKKKREREKYMFGLCSHPSRAPKTLGLSFKERKTKVSFVTLMRFLLEGT